VPVEQLKHFREVGCSTCGGARRSRHSRSATLISIGIVVCHHASLMCNAEIQLYYDLQMILSIFSPAIFRCSLTNMRTCLVSSLSYSDIGFHIFAGLCLYIQSTLEGTPIPSWPYICFKGPMFHKPSTNTRRISVISLAVAYGGFWKDLFPAV
jgi:hypothetical protein